MRTALIATTIVATFSLTALAQDHGTITINGKTIALTGYRTRVQQDRRSVIADGKDGGKLYSITISLRPDVTAAGPIKTDRTHTATVTISNADYSGAENFCFDGGGMLQVTPASGGLAITGKDLPSGNCMGAPKAGGGTLTFTMKP